MKTGLFHPKDLLLSHASEDSLGYTYLCFFQFTVNEQALLSERSMNILTLAFFLFFFPSPNTLASFISDVLLHAVARIRCCQWQSY